MCQLVSKALSEYPLQLISRYKGDSVGRLRRYGRVSFSCMGVARVTYNMQHILSILIYE